MRREAWMNFLCDRCKQKYHVADEKIRGRAVTRFKCKKCEHVIELRASGVDAAATGAPSEELTGAREVPASLPPPPPSPPRVTAQRPASVPPGAAPRPATGTALPTARAPLPGAPSRPATGIGLSTAAATAAAQRPATSSGLPSAARAPGPAIAPAPRPPTGTGLPTANRAVVAPRPATGTGLPTAARSASPVTSAPSPSPLRSGLAGKSDPSIRSSTAASALVNAAETGWYAGVRDLPVGPLSRAEMMAKIEAGDITPDSLVWREGLDDWRPLRSVEELSDLLRQSTAKMSDGLLGTMGRPHPVAPSGKVVPIAQARPAAPARGSFDAADESDDEPTRMTSLADLVAKAEQPEPRRESSRAPAAAPATTSSRPSVAPAPLAAPTAKPASPEPARAAPVARAATAPAPAAAPLATASAAPSAAAVAPAASPFPIVNPVPAATQAPGRAGPNDPTVNVEPAPARPAAAAVLNVPAPGASMRLSSSSLLPGEITGFGRRRKAGVPIGVWILMAGVGVGGVAVGIFLRPAPVTVAAPVSTPTVVRAGTEAPSTRTVGAEIRLPTTDPATTAPAPVAVAQPVAPASAAAAAPTEPGPHHVAGAAHASTGTGAPPAGGGGHAGGLSAAQLALLNSQLGSQSGGVVQASGPATTQLRNTPQASEDNGGLTGQARAGQVIDALRRANVVGDCWTGILRRNAAHPAENVVVELDVSPNGRASRVNVSGAQDPELASCIQNRSRSQPFGAGGSVTARVSFNLVSGQ